MDAYQFPIPKDAVDRNRIVNRGLNGKLLDRANRANQYLSPEAAAEAQQVFQKSIDTIQKIAYTSSLVTGVGTLLTLGTRLKTRISQQGETWGVKNIAKALGITAASVTAAAIGFASGGFSVDKRIKENAIHQANRIFKEAAEHQI